MYHMKHFILLLVLSVAFPVRAQLQIREVYVENKKTPVGILSANPRMSWILDADKRATRQVAYEIRVAGSEAEVQSGNALHWHSGKVASGQSVHVPYSGKALQSGTFYFWQIWVWDNHNRTSKWSEVAQWQMGLLDPEREFQAK